MTELATGIADPGEVRPLRLPPGAPLFQRRAERLADLAPGNPTGDFLELLARVCEVQARLAGELRLSPNGRDLPAAWAPWPGPPAGG
jgi:formate dehydrogenase maturation protein FdhE